MNSWKLTTWNLDHRITTFKFSIEFRACDGETQQILNVLDSHLAWFSWSKMKNDFTRNKRDFTFLSKGLKMYSLMDLVNTRQLIWNFMISIQYLNILLEEERSSANDQSSNTELLLFWTFFKQRYIGTADSWTEYLALRIWFTSIVAVCRSTV